MIVFHLTYGLFCHTFVIMKIQNNKIFEVHASYCRALANPKRLALLACLDRREMSVGELADTLEVPMPTVSRHLSLLKSKHLVKARQEGTKVFYSASDPRIVEACTMIRTVLIEGMKQRGEMAMEIDPQEIITDD